MATYDLRDLSAPIEALREEVTTAYARLDAEWNLIASKLRELPIPCLVSFAFEQDELCPCDKDCLEFRKWKGSKRLCIVSYSEGQGEYGWEENCDVTPYEEWSGEQRVAMLAHVPKLFEAAVSQTRDFVAKTLSIGKSLGS